MANGLGSVATARAAIPQTLVKGNQQSGEIRVLFSTYTVPASGGPAIGEYISWGYLPAGSRVVGGLLTNSAGAASSTINLGDPASAARYLAATAVTSAANTSLNPPATFTQGAAGFEVSVVTPAIAGDHSELRSTVAGAALQAAQTFTLFLMYAAND